MDPLTLVVAQYRGVDDRLCEAAVELTARAIVGVVADAHGERRRETGIVGHTDGHGLAVDVQRACAAQRAGADEHMRQAVGMVTAAEQAAAIGSAALGFEIRFAIVESQRPVPRSIE